MNEYNYILIIRTDKVKESWVNYVRQLFDLDREPTISELIAYAEHQKQFKAL